MKAVIILAALAFVLVAGLEAEQSSEILQREARDARRTPLGKSRKNRRKGQRKIKRRRQGKKKAKKSSTNRKAARTDCLADVVQAIKYFKKAQSQYRQAKRIGGWMDVMDKKKGKAEDDSQFKNATDALESATGGGMSCSGGAPDSEAVTALEVLKNCSISAAKKCDSTMITGINSTKLTMCETETKAYVDKFDECLRDPSCDCFTALLNFDKDMCDMTTTYDSAKASKTMCNSPNEKGSFGECTQKLKDAGHLVGKCKPSCDTPVMTTMMTRNLNARRKALSARRD